MKNRLPKIHMYTFKMYKEIESCYTCPACEQHPDYGDVTCNILEKTFHFKDDFPEDCPMEENEDGAR